MAVYSWRNGESVNRLQRCPSAVATLMLNRPILAPYDVLFTIVRECVCECECQLAVGDWLLHYTCYFCRYIIIYIIQKILYLFKRKRSELNYQ